MPMLSRRDSESSSDSWSLVDDQNDRISASDFESDDDVSEVDVSECEEPIIEEPDSDLEEDSTQYDTSDSEEEEDGEVIEEVEEAEVVEEVEEVAGVEEMEAVEETKEVKKEEDEVRRVGFEVDESIPWPARDFFARRHAMRMRCVEMLNEMYPDPATAQKKDLEPYASRNKALYYFSMAFMIFSLLLPHVAIAVYKVVTQHDLKPIDPSLQRRASLEDYNSHEWSWSLKRHQPIVFYDNTTSTISLAEKLRIRKQLSGPLPPLNVCPPRDLGKKVLNSTFKIYRPVRSIYNVGAFEIMFTREKRAEVKSLQPFYNPTSKRRFSRKHQPTVFPCYPNRTRSMSPCHQEENNRNLPSVIYQHNRGYSKWYEIDKMKKGVKKTGVDRKIRVGLVDSKKASQSMRQLIEYQQCDGRKASKYLPRRRSIVYKPQLPCLPLPTIRPTSEKKNVGRRPTKGAKKTDWFIRRGNQRAALRNTFL